ncbi:hypothetical protein WDW37_03460 [Bdellovibrionota bacterium FG-1]
MPQRLGILLAAFGLLGVPLSAPRMARANSGNLILETMGVSIAVGTVLGASTLPFYDQPGKHLMNTAYGASIGAVVGIGILVYGLMGRPVQDGFDDYVEFRQPGSTTQLRRSSASNVHHLNLETGFRGAVSLAAVLPPVEPTRFWMPVVSLNW